MRLFPRAALRRLSSSDDLGFLLGRGAIDLVVRVAGVTLTLGWTLLLTRLLGVEQYGRFAYILSAAFFISLIAGCGFPTSAGLFVVRYRDRRRMLGRFMTFAVVVNGLGPALAVAAIWYAARAGGADIFLGFTFWEVAAFCVAAAQVQLLLAVNRALERPVRGVLAEQVWQRLAALAAFGLLLLAGAPTAAETALMASLAGAAIAALLMAQPLRAVPPALAGLGRTVARTGRPWMRRSLVMMMTPAFFLVLSETDVLMLGALAGPAAVGVYHVARRLAWFLRFFNMAIIGVGMHRFAAARGDSQRLQHICDVVTAAGTLPAALLLCLFLVSGDWMLGLFGPGLEVGWPILLILAAGAVVELAMGPATEVLVMTGHESRVGRVNIVFALVNVGLNALLITLYGGVGAAAASIVTTVLWKAVLVSMARRHLGVRTWLSPAIVPRLLSMVRA